MRSVLSHACHVVCRELRYGSMKCFLFLLQISIWNDLKYEFSAILRLALWETNVQCYFYLCFETLPSSLGIKVFDGITATVIYQFRGSFVPNNSFFRFSYIIFW